MRQLSRIVTTLLLGCALVCPGAAAAERPATRAPLSAAGTPARAAGSLDYEALAQRGIAQASSWRNGDWYCEYLGCAHGPYSLLTVWGEVPMFDAVDALVTGPRFSVHRV